MHLRSYREKSKDELARDFFNVPSLEQLPGPGEPPSVVKLRNVQMSPGSSQGLQGMEINAVLSVEGKEEVYVSRAGIRRLSGSGTDTFQAGRLNLLPPFLCFISLDRRSCRCTLPLYTIRRVERYVLLCRITVAEADCGPGSTPAPVSLRYRSQHGMACVSSAWRW